MKLVVSHLCDPVATVVVVEGEHSLVSLSQVPDAHCTIRTTRCKRVQTTLVVRHVQDLVDMGREREIARLLGLLPEINNLDGIF